MRNLLLIITTIVTCFLAGMAGAQKLSTNGHLTKRQAMEAIREHLAEMKKEKMRNYSKHTGTGKAQMKTTATDQLVDNTPDEQAEVSLAVHPLDSNKLVLSFMDQSMTTPLDFPVFYSSNGGKTWNQSGFSPLDVFFNMGYLPMGGGDPVFAWDKNGRVYMSWLYIGVTQQFDTAFPFTFWAYSDDNGANWQMESGENCIIAKGAMDANTNQMYGNYFGMADRQWLAVDNSGGPNQGALYCSSFFVPGDENPNKIGALVQVKAPGSNHFNTGSLAYNGQTQFANVQVDNAGVVHVSFADLFTDEILHASSSDGGQSYSQTHLVGTGNNLFGGLNLIHDRENAATNLAIGKDNSLHVVWSDYTSVANAYYSRSTDGGNSWSTPIDLNAKYQFKHSMMPTVAADNGVSVFFTGINNADSANYYSVNINNGVASGTAAQISSGTTYYPGYVSGEFFGDYNRAVRYNMTNYSAWTDGRNDNGPKVFFAQVQSYPDGIKEITAVTTKIKVGPLYPNPATETVSLKVATETDEEITVSVSDVTGKIILLKDFHIGKKTDIIELPLGNLSAGTAVLTVNNKNGLIATRVFVKS